MTPPRPLLRIGWAAHKAIHRVTGGRLGTRAAGRRVGTLFLVSTGRRSGAARRNGLYYLEDGRNLVVVASNAGDDADPRWWLNLQATADAEVELPGPARRPVRARRATDDEASRLWPRLVAANPEFAAYRARAARPIPIVILEPR